jgi:hypothetical protein
VTRPVTLITGASAGLGAEFARQCAARGEALLLVARRRDRMEALAAELGGEVHILTADLSAPGAAAQLAGDIEALGLHVRALINNAGFGLAGRFATLPPDRQREMIDLNVAALTELSRLFLPGMLERGRGGILNVASTAAFQAGPNMAVYYATKAYVLSLSEALHQELKGTGIHVTCLCPGPTRTEFFDVAGVKGKMFERMSADAAGVVRAGLRGLDRNRAIVIPGVANRIGAFSNRLLPRAAMRRIIARIKV